MNAADVVVALAIGLIAGIAAGLFGVGGGFVLVPAMVLFLDQTQHVAQGTSLMVIVPTALIGTAANLRRGNVETGGLAWLALGGAAGALLGALASVQLDGETLRRIFGVVLIVVSLRMLIRKTPDRG